MISQRLSKQKLLLPIILLWLSGCSGSSVDPSTPETSNSTAKTTEAAESDTNSEDTQPNTDQEAETDTLSPRATEILESVSSQAYYRKPDYKKTVNLPLQFITTQTGKKLSVRVTLPADESGKAAAGPFPVVLTQAAYNTNLLSSLLLGLPGNAMMGAPDSILVRRGYAQVAVDALGTGASEGGWELLGEEEQAGFADAVDWAHQQPWANGRLAVAGVSYMAISSLFAAQRRPDSIHAVFASLPMGDPYRGTVSTGGLINATFMSTWMSLTHMTSILNFPTALANPKYFFQLIGATNRHIQQVDDYYLPMIDATLNGDPTYTYYGDFWRKRSPLTNIDKITAPTFIIGALDDIFQRDEPLLYERLKANGVDTRLVVFNGSHTLNFVLSHFASEQVPAIDYLMLQWLDKHLKNMDTGVENIPAVIQHVKNYPTPSTPEAFQNDSYATTTSWPHPLASAERWYLHGDNSLSKSAPTGIEASAQMTNPEHPVGRAFKQNGLLHFEVEINDATLCSRSYEQWVLGIALPRGCYNNTQNSKQQRVLFESAPMAEDYYINGPIQADIWIESSAVEAVVAVQIEEVAAKREIPLTNGQLLASVRAVDTEQSRYLNGEMIQPYHYFTEEKSELLVPGEVVKLQIEIFPTSAIIRKGNKLRIAISPSNQAQGMLNYPRQTLAEDGVTTIHMSDEYPSSVVFPVVPTSALN